MQFSTLLLLAAATLTLANPTPLENTTPAPPSIEKRWDLILGCCNPENNYAYKQVASWTCCDAVGGGKTYNRGNLQACTMQYADQMPYDSCCAAEGRKLGTPDWKNCIY